MFSRNELQFPMMYVIFSVLFGPFLYLSLSGGICVKSDLILEIFHNSFYVLKSDPDSSKSSRVFSASPFIGPPVGPMIAGFINQYSSWRWTFYVLLIWSVVMLGLISAFVPETYHPVLLRHKAVKLREETGDEKWKAPIERLQRSIWQTIVRSVYRPFLLLTLEPMCLNLCLFSAILLGVLYLFFGAFEIVFTQNHNFELWQVGLSFSGLLFGQLFAISTDPFWHRNYLRLIDNREKNGGEPGGSEPEYRLPPAIAGSFLVPMGLFWFAWTTYPSIHWIVPIIGSAVFSAGMVLVFSGVFTFLVDAYPLYAASALAANSFARSSFAAAFPLFGDQSKRRQDSVFGAVEGFLCFRLCEFG